MLEKTRAIGETQHPPMTLEEMSHLATMSKSYQSNIRTILDERGSRYGDFRGHAQITQSIKMAMQRSPKWLELTDSQREALEMTAHKIGRILNGDPDYLDSWVDIVGYTQLVIDQLKAK